MGFASKDENKMKVSQIKLDQKIKEGKRKYKEKISKSFQSNNMKDVWDKMKTVVCFDKTRPQVTVDDGQTYADELNDFYSRFDKDSTPDENKRFKIDNFASFDDDVPIFRQEDTCRVFRSL